MHQEVGAGCPGSLDGLPELLLSELRLTQTHMQINADNTHSDEDTNPARQTHGVHFLCMLFMPLLWSNGILYGRLRETQGEYSCISSLIRLLNLWVRFVQGGMRSQIKTYNSTRPLLTGFPPLSCLLCVDFVAFFFFFLQFKVLHATVL